MAIPTSYMTAVKNVQPILVAIQHAAVPDRFSYEFLKNLGFLSSNDRPVIPVLKAIGFLDPNGTPTEQYRRYRNPPESKQVLAAALRDGYGDLFAVNQEAHELTPAELRGLFMRLTGKQERVAEQMAMTFRAFASHADFSDDGAGDSVTSGNGHVSAMLDKEVESQGIHPLILGLIRELPPRGEPFPAARQRDWLNIAEATFRLIYGGRELMTSDRAHEDPVSVTTSHGQDDVD